MQDNLSQLMDGNRPQNAQQGNAYYVYCVAENSAAQFGSGALPEAIEDDSALEWVSANELSALTSRYLWRATVKQVWQSI